MKLLSVKLTLEVLAESWQLSD